MTFVQTISNFKSKTLLSIASLYQLAGLSPSQSPFLLGFGNRVTDARAYQSAGIDAASIFILDNSSQVTLWSHSSARNDEDGDSKFHTPPRSQQGLYTGGYDDPVLASYIDAILDFSLGR